jgi:hypothetical protein
LLEDKATAIYKDIQCHAELLRADKQLLLAEHHPDDLSFPKEFNL